MTDWDGHGLPPVAQRRVARAAASQVRSSLLSVAGQTGLAHFGFAPVGEVMGCAVISIGFQGYAGCGWYGMPGMMPMGRGPGGFAGGYGRPGYGGGYGGGYAGGYGPPMQTITRRSGGPFSLAPYLNTIDAAWALALSRMSAEAEALGADGVVDVRISEARLSQVAREFVVLGTAVRSSGTGHVTRPFTTTLGGSDTAKLFSSGSTPMRIIVANAVGIRHDDWTTLQNRSAWAGNIEVVGYSDLVTATRADCRAELRAKAAEAGADGAIVSGAMTMEVHEIEVGEAHTDHVCTARIIGTAIGKMRAERVLDPPRPVISLKDR